MSNECKKYPLTSVTSVILDFVDQENRPLKLQPDGTAEFLEPGGRKVGKYRRLTYEQMRDAVEGMIEYVHFKRNGKQRHMLVNEEGLIHGMPYNPLASKLVAPAGYEGVVGPVIIFPGSRES